MMEKEIKMAEIKVIEIDTTETKPPEIKTMFNYFTKLPSKVSIVEENPRKLAPFLNRQHVVEFQSRLEQFDSEIFIDVASERKNYLTCIKSKEHEPFRLNRKVKGPLRARLLQFHQDVRPPYFGTWQKKSKSVGGRTPFRMDDDILNYDEDSEAEWDVGGPGESLEESENEEEEMDDYEIDMKTFVPHGYVSDDEVDETSDGEQNSSKKKTNNDESMIVEPDSDSDLQIISDSRPTQLQQQQQQQQQPKQPTTVEPKRPPPPKKTPNMDIKSKIIGINFEDNPIISQEELKSLRQFQGVYCN